MNGRKIIEAFEKFNQPVSITAANITKEVTALEALKIIGQQLCALGGFLPTTAEAHEHLTPPLKGLSVGHGNSLSRLRERAGVRGLEINFTSNLAT